MCRNSWEHVCSVADAAAQCDLLDKEHERSDYLAAKAQVSNGDTEFAKRIDRAIERLKTISNTENLNLHEMPCDGSQVATPSTPANFAKALQVESRLCLECWRHLLTFLALHCEDPKTLCTQTHKLLDNHLTIHSNQGVHGPNAVLPILPPGGKYVFGHNFDLPKTAQIFGIHIETGHAGNTGPTILEQLQRQFANNCLNPMEDILRDVVKKRKCFFLYFDATNPSNLNAPSSRQLALGNGDVPLAQFPLRGLGQQDVFVPTLVEGYALPWKIRRFFLPSDYRQTWGHAKGEANDDAEGVPEVVATKDRVINSLKSVTTRQVTLINPSPR